MPKSSKYKTSNKSAIYKRGYPLTLQIMTWLKYDEISKQTTSHSAKFAGFLKIKTIAKTSPTRKAVPALKAKFQNKRRPLNKKISARNEHMSVLHTKTLNLRSNVNANKVPETTESILKILILPVKDSKHTDRTKDTNSQ